MSMFPGANAHVYYNEAGEPLGWDYPSEPDEHYDPEDYLPSQEPELCWHCDSEEPEDVDEAGRPICATCVNKRAEVGAG